MHTMLTTIKAKHCYWPGLLLVLHFILLLVFGLNPQQDSSINLLAILVGTGVLVVWAWVSGGVYRNWCLGALEGSFALNLITLAAATFFVNQSRGNQLAVAWVHLHLHMHSTCNLHWHLCLPHLPATEALQAVEGA